MAGRISEMTDIGGDLDGTEELETSDPNGGGTGIPATFRFALSRIKTYIQAGLTMAGAIDMNSQVLSGFKGNVVPKTDDYTTTDADAGDIIVMDKATANTLTIHTGAPAGFNVGVIQKGAGQTTVAATGGNVRNQSSHTKMAGQYAMGSIIVESNAGSAPEAYLGGDTGT